jgi:2-methylcitrate dehydratase
MTTAVELGRETNQALGLGQFAIDFMSGALGPGPTEAVLERTRLFHLDSVLCALSALALKTNAPSILAQEARAYPDPKGAKPFATDQRCKAEKAIVANCSAVREWDSNGTNFGFNPASGNNAGEFGHNDYYPVAIAGAQEEGLNGSTALRAMVLLDEIRGRLAEVFSLKTHKIDHVLHGAIAAAATYGALRQATPEQIESAIGMVVAHYVPWRAIRAGKQLSDSKGASAAISTEVAILSVKRSLAGFRGPRDIFRNPESLFRRFEPTQGGSPFDLTLTHSGDDFAVQGMHFKIGLYEHQSAGGIQAILNLLSIHPPLRKLEDIEKIVVTAYEPAFGIIGDPAKRDPQTRQSADHSMVFILATVLKKAAMASPTWETSVPMPDDYAPAALSDPAIQGLIRKIEFRHGGADYDRNYPDGIPTSVKILNREGKWFDSGLVMYPAGHARDKTTDLMPLLVSKFEKLGAIAFDDPESTSELIARMSHIDRLDAVELGKIYEVTLAVRDTLDFI